MTWWQEDDTLHIVSSQSGSSLDTPFFRTHLDFMLRLIDGSDTLVRQEQTEAVQTYSIPVSGKVAEVLPDPYNWILDVTTIVKRPVQSGAFIVGPNPFTNEIFIEFSNSNVPRGILITDMAGKILARYETENAIVSIPMKNIVRGVYLITVIENGKSYTSRIVRK
jgi:hypothetical protein